MEFFESGIIVNTDHFIPTFKTFKQQLNRVQKQNMTTLDPTAYKHRRCKLHHLDSMQLLPFSQIQRIPCGHIYVLDSNEEVARAVSIWLKSRFAEFFCDSFENLLSRQWSNRGEKNLSPGQKCGLRKHVNITLPTSHEDEWKQGRSTFKLAGLGYYNFIIKVV